ncbi:MAG: hypothetical protein HY000_23060 [Planctomycetes bacterium]|nr:hypothetical protein [Planctomycetota bacterium]
MTLLGKILVVLVLSLCLLCMGFAATVYTAQHNWPEAYKKVQQQNTELRNANGVAKTELENLSAALDKTVKDNAESQAALDAKLKELQTEVVRLRDIEQQAQEAARANQERAREALQEAESRRAEVERVRLQWNQSVVERDQANLERTKARDELYIAQTNLNAAAARNKELVSRVGELDSLLRKYNIDPEKEQIGLAPPPNVEGIVLRTAADGSDLLEISIGSDDGLRAGHPLYVYRLGSTPAQARYLGKIEVREVDPDRAVAKIVRPLKGKIQKDDHVSSRIR